MSRRLLRPTALAAAAAILGALAGAPVTPAAAASTAATFNPNLLLQGSNNAAEPSIRTDKFGRAFVIGPVGVAAGCKAFRTTSDGSASTYLGQPDHQAGGGDCDWALGPQETAATISPPGSDNVLSYSSLTAANITVGKSDDGGKTFGPPNPGAAQVGGDDRMWMDADPKLNTGGLADIFMTYHDVSLGNIEMSVSIDGGQSYVQNSPLIINLPPGQWAGALAGNELGNIVAHRDATGKLTLYSIFETPDSANDNTCQALAGTANFNRVYEAVGVVTADTAPPAIAWTDYEIYHGPATVYQSGQGACPGPTPVETSPGARYNRIFPITTVDSAGQVYAFWSDGNHIDYKTDPSGTDWTATTAPAQIANPTGVNTVIMPWAQAGKAGIADIVFYGAHGGNGSQPNPQDDPGNIWNVYFAQTLNSGGTWTVTQAGDHVIHTGPLCIDGLNCNLIGNRDRTLLDFFQVAIDPKDGDADIAYADDHASPGNSVLYYTKQCTGISATTGAALKTACNAPPLPPTPPQGTTCPGPQIVDFVGDAPNNYPGGDGQNMDNLDIVNAFFGTPDNGRIQVTMTINNLSAPPPPVNLLSAFWTVYWTFNGTEYFAQATSNGTGNTAVFSFSDGTYSNGNFNPNPNGTPTGVVTYGKNGTIVITFPRADVGKPPNGATLTNTFADTHGSFTVLGTGVYYTAPADRAPNSGFGANYVVGQTCTPPPPPPACHEADANGDIHGKKDGNENFHADEDTCESDGDTPGVQSRDPGSNMNFQSTMVASVVFNDAANMVTMTGTGLDNGNPVTFTMVATDLGSTALDTFQLTLSDGYSNSGTLLDGTITLH
jgi:hypothetical protein